jgi:ribosomal protein S18 acetylase RimI-like enzyme
MRFRPLSSRGIPAALPWVHAAGQPYIDWLLGGRAATLRILEQWMRRPSSEVFMGRVVVVEDRQPVGGFIAIPGGELARCRMQDALAAAAAAPEQRSLVARKLRLGRGLFAEVHADELYLSRMGVVAQARRRGYGKAIVREYLRNGALRGFRRFTLDVCSGNLAAIELYRSFGFRAEREHQVRDVEMTYVRMALEVSTAQEPSGESDERVTPPLTLETGHERGFRVDDAQQLRVARVDERATSVPEQAPSPHNRLDETGLKAPSQSGRAVRVGMPQQVVEHGADVGLAGGNL